MQTMDPKPGMIAAMKQCVQTSGVLWSSLALFCGRQRAIASNVDLATGFRGLFEGLSATWFRGMTYALVRFWTYDVAKAELNKRKSGVLERFPSKHLLNITFCQERVALLYGMPLARGSLQAPSEALFRILAVGYLPSSKPLLHVEIFTNKTITIDIVLIRMQAERGKAASQRYGYRNAIHGLYCIARDEGPRKLLRGVDVTVFRAILTNTGQLAS
jgi:dicarboxylate transporter 10